MNPLISVIIPTYNSAEFITDALKSVFAQTFPDYEVIVIDDGSTDATADIVKSFPGVKYLRQNHRGPAAARNLGLSKSSSPLIAFLDADDQWMDDKLEIQTRYMNSHPDVGLLYSDLSTFDDDGVKTVSYDSHHRKVYQGNVFDKLFLKNFIGTITVMVRKECFERAGYFNEEITRSTDWHQWLRIAYFYKVGYIDKPLAKYRWNKGSISYDSARAYPDRLQIIGDIVALYPDYFARQKTLVRRAYGGGYFRYGYALFQAGESREAAGKWGKSLRNNPLQWKVYLYLLGLLIPGRFRGAIAALKRKIGLRFMPAE